MDINNMAYCNGYGFVSPQSEESRKRRMQAEKSRLNGEAITPIDTRVYTTPEEVLGHPNVRDGEYVMISRVSRSKTYTDRFDMACDVIDELRQYPDYKQLRPKFLRLLDAGKISWEGRPLWVIVENFIGGGYYSGRSPKQDVPS